MLRKIFLPGGSRSQVDTNKVRSLVEDFLDGLQVVKYEASAHILNEEVIVHVQAEPQRELRYSNLIEIQIKNAVKNGLGADVSRVFWRFRTDIDDERVVEQSIYNPKWSAYADTPKSKHGGTTDVKEVVRTPVSAHKIEVNHDVSMEEYQLCLDQSTRQRAAAFVRKADENKDET